MLRIRTDGNLVRKRLRRNKSPQHVFAKALVFSVAVFSKRGQPKGFGGVVYPMSARIFARTSANSSADTTPFRVAFRTRQSKLFT